MAAPVRDRREVLYEAYLRVPEHQHAEIVNGTRIVEQLRDRDTQLSTFI